MHTGFHPVHGRGDFPSKAPYFLPKIKKKRWGKGRGGGEEREGEEREGEERERGGGGREREGGRENGRGGGHV